MTKRNAKGTQCLLMRGIDGDHYIRIYDKKYPEGFKDYTILYDDLRITITEDDAVFDDEAETLDVDWDNMRGNKS